MSSNVHALFHIQAGLVSLRRARWPTFSWWMSIHLRTLISLEILAGIST